MWHVHAEHWWLVWIFPVCANGYCYLSTLSSDEYSKMRVSRNSKLHSSVSLETRFSHLETWLVRVLRFDNRVRFSSRDCQLTFEGYCMYLGNLSLRLLLSVRLTFTFTCTQVRSVCTRFSVALDNWIMCNMNIPNLCFCY